MKYLPYDHITLQSSLSASQVQDKIKNYLATNTTYEGSIHGQSFSIKRSNYSINSFTPHIEGRIKKQPNGSIIDLKVSVNPIVMIFMILWMGFWVFSFLATIIGTLTEPRPVFTIHMLFPLGIAGIGYLIAMGGFKPASRSSISFFRSFLSASIESSPK